MFCFQYIINLNGSTYIKILAHCPFKIKIQYLTLYNVLLDDEETLITAMFSTTPYTRKDKIGGWGYSIFYQICFGKLINTGYTSTYNLYILIYIYYSIQNDTPPSEAVEASNSHAK